MFYWGNDLKENRRRFKLIDPQEVQAALEANKITDRYLINLLSDEQLKSLQLSKLSKDQIEQMFYWGNDLKENRRRFLLINSNERNLANQKGILTEELSRLQKGS